MSDDDDDAPALPAGKRRALPPSRKAVVAKLWRAAKRQLDAHEARLEELPKGAGASEADAKALAVLARTVRELVAMEATTTGREDTSSNDLLPADGLRHVAELRKELARRLEVLAAGEADSAVTPAPADGDA